MMLVVLEIIWKNMGAKDWRIWSINMRSLYNRSCLNHWCCLNHRCYLDHRCYWNRLGSRLTFHLYLRSCSSFHRSWSSWQISGSNSKTIDVIGNVLHYLKFSIWINVAIFSLSNSISSFDLLFGSLRCLVPVIVLAKLILSMMLVVLEIIWKNMGAKDWRIWSINMRSLYNRSCLNHWCCLNHRCYLDYRCYWNRLGSRLTFHLYLRSCSSFHRSWSSWQISGSNSK